MLVYNASALNGVLFLCCCHVHL